MFTHPIVNICMAILGGLGCIGQLITYCKDLSDATKEAKDEYAARKETKEQSEIQNEES